MYEDVAWSASGKVVTLGPGLRKTASYLGRPQQGRPDGEAL